MIPTTALAQLDAYQLRVQELTQASRQFIRRDAAAAQPDLAHTRWQLLRVLREYQLFKHNEVFDPLIAASRPELVAMASRLKAACMRAAEDYRLHTLHWSEHGAADRWEEYQAAVLSIAERIDEHLETERAAIALLLSNVSRTRKP